METGIECGRGLFINQTEHKVERVKILPFPFFTNTFQGHCDHPSNCNFEWNSKEQGLILGSFAIGYILTQYLGGFLADRYGGKFVFGLGLLFDCMLNLILPWLTVKFEVPALMTIKIIQGALQGIIIPAMFSMTAKWTPKPEKNRMMIFMISGCVHIQCVR